MRLSPNAPGKPNKGGPGYESGNPASRWQTDRSRASTMLCRVNAMKKPLNRRQAIRKRCLDCSGFSSKEVKTCIFKICPLFPYRLEIGKQNPQARDKAIRKYCLHECMNGQRYEVRLCPSGDCPLFKFRQTRNTVVNGRNTSYRGNSRAIECLAISEHGKE